MVINLLNNISSEEAKDFLDYTINSKLIEDSNSNRKELIDNFRAIKQY